MTTLIFSDYANKKQYKNEENFDSGIIIYTNLGLHTRSHYQPTNDVSATVEKMPTQSFKIILLVMTIKVLDTPSHR